jgi:hypothetical protein
MRARYYEPATGRFISEDPARDGVNWYLYADGNPVGKVDFTGKFFTFGDILFGGLDEAAEKAIAVKNAQLVAKFSENAIERALLNYAKRYLEVAKDLAGIIEDVFKVYTKYSNRIQIVGVHGRYGIGIDFTNMGDPVIKLYKLGQHISKFGVPWEVPFSTLL